MQISLFRALADPHRQQIVETLLQGERQVAEVAEALDIHQSGVSRHLRILLDAGIVAVRPAGQRRLYSLRAEPFQDLARWTDRYRTLWERRLDRFGAALENNPRSPRKP